MYWASVQLCTNKVGYIEIELRIKLVEVYVASQVTFAPISIRHSNYIILLQGCVTYKNLFRFLVQKNYNSYSIFFIAI